MLELADTVCHVKGQTNIGKVETKFIKTNCTPYNVFQILQKG